MRQGSSTEGGGVGHRPGELLFGWIIDGRALQEIWIGYPKRSNDERTVGTSVRLFDSKSKLWRVVFVASAFGVLTLMQGGAEGDRIVLRGWEPALRDDPAGGLEVAQPLLVDAGLRILGHQA